MKTFKINTLIGLVVIFSFLFGINFVFAVDLPDPRIDLPQGDDLEEIIVNAINWIAGIIATVSVLAVAVGGFLWVTAGGEEDRAKSARKWVIAGLAGLALALSAFILVNIVANFFV